MCIDTACTWIEEKYPDGREKLASVGSEDAAQDSFYGGPWFTAAVEAWLKECPSTAPYGYLENPVDKFLLISGKAKNGNPAAKREVERIIVRSLPVRIARNRGRDLLPLETQLVAWWTTPGSYTQVAQKLGIRATTLRDNCATWLRGFTHPKRQEAIPTEVREFFREPVLRLPDECAGCLKPREHGRAFLEVHEGKPFHHRCWVAHKQSVALRILAGSGLSKEEVVYVIENLERTRPASRTP